MSKVYKSTFVIVICIAGLALVRFLLFFSDREEECQPLFEQVFRDNYRIFAPQLPENIDFAGEPVPLQLVHIRERLDREILVNTYWHSSTLQLFKRANRFFPMIERVLKEEGIPDDFKYLSLIESGFLNVVSPKGATGFWQFLDGSAKEFGLEVNGFVDERYHHEKSTYAACNYLKNSYERFGNWTLVAAAFNAGNRRMDEVLQKQQVHSYYDLHLNEETFRYVFRILAIKAIFEQPVKYGFYLRETDLYPPVPVRIIDVTDTIADLVEFSLQEGVNYMLLKHFNPWLRKDILPVKPDRTYRIELPVVGATDYQSLIKEYDECSIIGDSITVKDLLR